MILYRCLTNGEILSMINNEDYQTPLICGENTFHYEQGCSYKHFFVFAKHAYFFREANKKSYPVIAQYIIPNNIIKEKGFGFYGGIKTRTNDKLYNWYIPLPEIMILSKFFNKEYLYKIESDLYNDFTNKILDRDDNIKFNEPTEEYLICNLSKRHGIDGCLDYSYADIYYEMVYSLAKQNDMNMYKVAKILKDIDFHDDIKAYFFNNISLFKKQTKAYLKEKKYKFY